MKPAPPTPPHPTPPPTPSPALVSLVRLNNHPTAWNTAPPFFFFPNNHMRLNRKRHLNRFFLWLQKNIPGNVEYIQIGVHELFNAHEFL